MTEVHYQTIDDFIQKSTVTDDRPKEEREKTTTISRCKKGQDVNLTDTSKRADRSISPWEIRCLGCTAQNVYE
jgi:hypothetical protein